MSLRRISTKTDEFLLARGIDHPEIRQLIAVHALLVLGGASLSALLGAAPHMLAFLLGGGLSFANFYLLARLIPNLVWAQKGGTFALLFGFYLRLLLTGLILFLAVAWLKMPVLSLLLGLSTVFLNILIWLGKFVLTHKHKEA